MDALLTKYVQIGTWADHIIIQEVANSHNLRILITESMTNFSEPTIVSSNYASEHGGSGRDIYIEHLDEMHYISTTPINDQTVFKTHYPATRDTTSTNFVKHDKILSQSSSNSKGRKEYMREYTKKRRMNSEFKTKENEREKMYNNAYKLSNHEKVKDHRKEHN